MPLTALVIAHSEDLTVERIEKFHAAMDGLDFVEVPNIPMAWAAHYPEGELDTHQDEVRREALDAVSYAAKKAGLSEFSLAVQVGPDTPAILTDKVE
ncbi:MAG: hypothetical protein AAF658_06425 [Myxococcota bacterium]